MHTTTPPADTSAPTGMHSRGPRIFPGGDPQPLTARRIRRTKPAPDIAHAPHRGRKTMHRGNRNGVRKESGDKKRRRGFFRTFFTGARPGHPCRAHPQRLRPSVLSPRQRRNGQAGSFSPFRKRRSVFRIRKPHFRLRPDGSGTDPHARKTAAAPARPGTRSGNASEPAAPSAVRRNGSGNKRDDCRIRRPHPRRNENRGTRSPRLAKRNFPGDGLER